MKQKLIISLILLLFIASSCKNKTNQKPVNESDTTATAQNSENIDEETIEFEELSEIFYRHYSGKIGDSKIQLNLSKSKENLYGTYFYNNIKQNIYLEGSIDNENNIEIHEYVEGNKSTGTFTGKIYKNKIIGTWKNESKEFDFKLNEDYSNSIRFANYERTENYKMFGIDSFPQYTIDIETLYPIDKNGKPIENISKIIFDSFYPNRDVNVSAPQIFDNYVNDLIESYKETCENEEDDYETIMMDQFMYQWDYSIDWTITLNDNNLLSISEQSGGYSGGAHGYYSIQLLNIDTKKGKRLSINDIIIEGGKEELRQIILKKIEEDGRREDLFSIEDVTVTENFYLDINGIGFVYNPYEIGPYVVGIFDIYIKFNEIKHLLKPAFK